MEFTEEVIKDLSWDDEEGGDNGDSDDDEDDEDSDGDSGDFEESS